MDILAIKVEHLYKQYRLGVVSTGTLVHDINRWVHKLRGKEDPYSKVTTINDRTQKKESEYVWSLSDINFEVKQGDVLGVIGRNGAGKSTLLKVLSKITAPTKGTVKVNGRVASLLEVGTGFHPELTGRENIFLNGAILGMSKREIKTKFDQIVDFSGVEMYIDTPVKRYSSGMHVRLAFAVAAHLESEILIVDEVLAVGDAEFQKKCLGKMSEVSRGEGRTVLFVSHNMGAIQNLCTRSILLSNGCITFDGLVEEGIRKYNSSLVSLLQHIAVADRKDRTGSQVIKLISFKINGMECDGIIRLNSSDTLVVEMTFQSIDDYSGGRIMFGVYDENSQRPLFIDSDLEMIRLDFKKGLNHIKVSFPEKFSLGFGNYTMNYSVFNNIEVVDYIQQVAVFEVIESDFYQNSRSSQQSPRILIRTKWEISH